MRYKLVQDESLATTGVLVNDATHPTLAQGTSIPNDTNNRHWNEYLTWAQTNTADPADTIDYMQRMRDERDRRMNAMEWRINRNYRQTSNAETPTDNATKMTEIYTYMKSLADMPQTNPSVPDKASYDALVWPTEPI